MRKIGEKFSLMLILFSGLSLVAEAADLQVRVFERGGHVPMPGVSVCLGTQARLDQFGSAQTDRDGYALFSDVPGAQLVVTASRPGFMTEQESLLTSNTDRLLVLTLPAGGGGPRCLMAGEGAGKEVSGLNVRRFAINDDSAVTSNRTVRLHNSVDGLATHLRASEREDMAGAQWQYYAMAPEFTLSEGAGEKRVYLQVRRLATVNGATLETESAVVVDSIQLR